jgi:hypothetical protein
LLDAALQGRRFPWIQADWVPGALALLVLAAGGLSIIVLQYARRTRWLARGFGLAVALGAVLTFAFMPRDVTAAMQCSLAPDPPRDVSVRFEPGLQVDPPVMMAFPDRVAVSIPVRVTGLEKTWRVWAEQLTLRVSARGGPSWETRRDLGIDRRAHLLVNPDRDATAQTLVPDRDFINAVGGAPVRIEGRASIRPYHQGEPRILPSTFPQTDVPGLGRCSASRSMPLLNREVLTVVCESPSEIQPLVAVTLVDPQTGREWRQRLGDSYTPHMVPAIHWLSPLNRRQTYLQIVEKESQLPGDRWLVPRSVLRRARIHIVPAVEEGCANVSYSFDVPNIREWQHSSGGGR